MQSGSTRPLSLFTFKWIERKDSVPQVHGPGRPPRSPALSTPAAKPPAALLLPRSRPLRGPLKSRPFATVLCLSPPGPSGVSPPTHRTQTRLRGSANGSRDPRQQGANPSGVAVPCGRLAAVHGTVSPPKDGVRAHAPTDSVLRAHVSERTLFRQNESQPWMSATWQFRPPPLTQRPVAAAWGPRILRFSSHSKALRASNGPRSDELTQARGVHDAQAKCSRPSDTPAADGPGPSAPAVTHSVTRLSSVRLAPLRSPPGRAGTERAPMCTISVFLPDFQRGQSRVPRDRVHGNAGMSLSEGQGAGPAHAGLC